MKVNVLLSEPITLKRLSRIPLQPVRIIYHRFVVHLVIPMLLGVSLDHFLVLRPSEACVSILGLVGARPSTVPP